ncbi:290982cb-4c7f-4d37-86a6-1dcc16fe345b [Thermothielavioides terrestris]|uniref:290982cb-4c7f-4d37-86a6-1dcc16fe345b n=1 Tax=Thermothielavioides terrestris TaxID=2587410 RepID=A0A3S4AS98_9PEZI|nr:290982cb-4c7f-4d37-86a6-1dcc16fe345b [Thermothielavioides terrestris]
MAVNAQQAASLPRKLWEHPHPESTLMYRFMQDLNRKHGLHLKTFADLHNFSLTNRTAFWSHLFEAARFIHEGTYSTVVDESAPIDAVPRWFDGVRLNFAENVLFSRPDTGADTSTAARGVKDKEDGRVAITEVREGASEVRTVTYGELRATVGALARAMKARGVGKGDRVVIVGANSVETAAVWFATTWLGAVFSSSSTDMGVKGILQRVVQVNPKMAEVVEGLRECSEFSGVVAIRRFAEARDVSRVPLAETWESFITAAGGNTSLPQVVRIGFHEPFLICYSSGTTGTPKAIVHSVGGVLINYYKEGRLHEGLGPHTVALQYTTTGWIMYLAAIGALLYGGRTVLYDGSPFQPDASILIRIAAEQRVTKLGVSPRWMFEVAKAGLRPREMAGLSSLETVTCTGMVLSNQLFEWFYDVGFPSHVHLANISGGTDIAGCFGIMNPLTPVYVGGTQGPSLGVHVAIYDSLLPDGVEGKEVPHGTPGELVATAPFPNIPCFLWGDKTPAGGGSPAAPGTKYHAAYFARFKHVWAHGDFCVVHPVTGNITFLGRADGVLNPSGVRFGSAEIYSVIERHFADRVQDSLCVGQRRPQDNDEAVMLFLLMKPGARFDRALVNDVREAIARDLSKRHVPKYIFETPEIPTTINLKKVELPVKQIVSGHVIKPSGTLANPQSLEYYYQFAKVEELVGPREKL